MILKLLIGFFISATGIFLILLKLDRERYHGTINLLVLFLIIGVFLIPRTLDDIINIPLYIQYFEDSEGKLIAVGSCLYIFDFLLFFILLNLLH